MGCVVTPIVGRPRPLSGHRHAQTTGTCLYTLICEEPEKLVAWNLQDFALFIGVDVGKSEHLATALTTTGENAYDKSPPNDEAELPDLLTELARKHGSALLVVDQPATIGALPVTVAQSMDHVEVAHLPGLTMPTALWQIAASDEQVAELADAARVRS